MEFIRAKVIQPIVAVFQQGLTPHALTLSLSLGVVGALFPIPGVTTVVCFAFIYAFGLNVAATQLVNLLLTPLELALVVPHMALGNWLLGAHVDLSEASALLASDLLRALSVLGASIARGVLAWTLLAAPLAAILYFALKPLVTRALRATVSDKDKGDAHKVK